ncbi:MAG: BamA/TamA family outer membrane protein [Thermoguttaceae bacterium]
MPNDSLAAASPADNVVDVKIAGNKSIPLAKILPSIHTRAGRPFNIELIREDVRRLDHTRQFVSVNTYWQQVPGGRVVIFALVERPVLTDVKFIGSQEIHVKTLRRETGLKVGDPADPYTIEEARRKIEDLYHKRGFNDAMVWMLEGSKFEDRRAIFVIDEGVKQRVWSTTFVGNMIDSGDRLRTQIDTSRPFLYLFGGEYDSKKVDEDVKKLAVYYRALGFFNARIGREVKFSESGKWANIQFVIDEGPRYKVRNVSVIGNKKYTNQELLADLKLKNNEYFNQTSMDADMRSLGDKYGGVGYVFADIKPEPRFLEEPGQLDLVYSISEGDRYRVGKIFIRIKGEYSHTQENTVRNRLFFKPGDIVDIRQIRASEVALKRSGLFESNPAQGNAPKISFNAPDREGGNPEDDDRQQVADKPQGGRRSGTSFRGQSPDGDSRDRELDLTLDCGRYIGTREDPPAQPNENRDERQNQQQPAAAQSACLAEGAGDQGSGARVQPGEPATPPDASSAPSDLVRQTQEYTEALSRAKAEERPRLQYLAPDDGWQSRPLPCNSAPGDSPYCGAAVPAARADAQAGGTPAPQGAFRQLRWTAPAVAQPQGAADEDVCRKALEYSQAVSQVGTGRESRDRVILTQYTTETSRANQASDESLRWWAPSEAAAANAENSAPATSAPVPPPSGNPSAPPPYGNPPAPPAAPVTPSPKVGNDQWPRQGPERVVNGPNGPYVPGPIFGENSPFRDGPPDGGPPPRPLGINISTEETMTGRLMFGVGINSDAGLVGQVVLDEQNFDWTRFPTSWEDVRDATAWRGAGQRLRIQAMPGTQVQNYSVTFQEPYMFGSQVSMSLSGYYYNRIYNEYTDQRLGGSIGFGYQFTPALSAGITYSGAKVNITNPIDPLLPDLAAVVGRDLAMHTFRLSTSLDKRDSAFLATEGYLVEASIEETLGSYEYPRARLELRKFFTLYERPDGSGRHVLSLSARAGWEGDNTPIYDRFYAGGFSTIRGFQFRGASPQEIGPSTGDNIIVGGDFQLLASVEYLFPITADDMVRGVVFCDSGTVEPTINDWSNRYRVAPGFGLRICVPMMGPAPIALDFAFPVSWQPGDHSEMFSFFVGFER